MSRRVLISAMLSRGSRSAILVIREGSPKLSELIEFMEVFHDKKKPVLTLLLDAARSRSIIRYTAMYGLFKDKERLCVAPNIWRACVWTTVEAACRELASPEGAIYTAVLSNKEGLPEGGFWDLIRGKRIERYQKHRKLVLPKDRAFTLEQKIDIARFERELVYRHAALYHPAGNPFLTSMMR